MLCPLPICALTSTEGSASATDVSDGDSDRTVLSNTSGQEAVPFTIDELYDAIRTGLVELADPSE